MCVFMTVLVTRECTYCDEVYGNDSHEVLAQRVGLAPTPQIDTRVYLTASGPRPARYVPLAVSPSERAFVPEYVRAEVVPYAAVDSDDPSDWGFVVEAGSNPHSEFKLPPKLNTVPKALNEGLPGWAQWPGLAALLNVARDDTLKRRHALIDWHRCYQGNLRLSRTPVSSLGGLRAVSGNLLLNGCERLSSLGALEEVGGALRIPSTVRDLGSLRRCDELVIERPGNQSPYHFNFYPGLGATAPPRGCERPSPHELRLPRGLEGLRVRALTILN